MRIFSLRRHAVQIFSFAGVGIARPRGSGLSDRHRRRRTAAGVIHLSGERLEGRGMLAGASLAGYAPDLAAADDSGNSSTDNYTNVTTPTFNFNPAGVTFAAGGETIKLLIDGIVRDSVVVTGGVYAGGSFTLTCSTALSDNPHSVTVVSDDGTGNGTASSALSITIDTVVTCPPARYQFLS